MDDAVWLDVLPNMSKFGPALTKGASGEADKVGKGVGTKFGLAAAAGVTAVAGGAVLAGKALFDLGSQASDMATKIQTSTGATGAELDKMTEAARLAGNRVPADMSVLGDAVVAVKSSMGDFAGSTSEQMAKTAESALVFSKAMEVDMTRASQVAGQMLKTGLAKDATEAFDLLTAASQKVPAALREDLIDAVDEYGPMMQQLGFDGAEAMSALASASDKGMFGIDKTGDALKEFTIRATDMSKTSTAAFQSMGLDSEVMANELLAGGDRAREAFGLIIGGLKDIEDPAAQANASIALFGTPLEDLGTGDIPKFLDSMSNLENGLGEVEGATASAGDAMHSDFGSQFTIFTQQLQQMFLPVASALFGALSDGMTWVNNYGIPHIKNLAAAFQSGEGPIGRLGTSFGNVVNFVKSSVQPVLGGLSWFFNDVFVPHVQKVVGVVSQYFLPIFQDVQTMFNERILPVLQTVSSFIATEVAPVIQDFSERVVGPAFEAIAAIVKWAWDTVLYPVLNGIWDIITNVVGPVFGWLWKNVVAPTFKNIGDAVSSFGDHWSQIWTGIQRAAAAPVNFVIETVYNNGLRKALNLIPGVNLAEAATIKVPSAGSGGGRGSSGGKTAYAAMAGGGILPGFSRYADGDDQLVWMRRGEGVTVSEALDPYERARLLALNAAALRGTSAEQFRSQFDGHAGGGIVGFRGHRFTSTFVAALKMAEAMSKTTFNISQGGFRPRTSYSGTSHRGDAVDIMSPITTAVITALRSAGIAAWDRTGKGKWAPHIHGVPLPGFGSAGGSAVWQAQDYLRGGDGLGGRDNGPRVAALGGGLFEIPELIKKAIDAIHKGMTDPWGLLLKSGALNIVDQVKAWATTKLDEIGDSFGDFVFGNQTHSFRGTVKELPRGYVNGTGWALPGLAEVGESGIELVTSPQVRQMRGGERVYSAAATRRLFGDDPSAYRLVRGELDITEDGKAYLRGVAEEVYDDREASEARWSGMVR